MCCGRRGCTEFCCHANAGHSAPSIRIILEKYDFGTTASWKLGATEISFSRVGQIAVFYVVHSD
jgi:hypothetical protein